MPTTIESTHHLSGEPHERTCALAIRALNRAEAPVLVGGAFAFTHYTGIVRDTKDLDLFVREDDVPQVLAALASEEFMTSVPFPHWLAKAQLDSLAIDIIFASGNGLGRVDDDWFQYARDATLYGERVRVTPPEEMLCSKLFVMERERYDGADVAHLLASQGLTLDWARIIRRLGAHVPLLYSHLVLFLYIYSDGAERLPPGLFDDLHERTRVALADRPANLLCRGSLISRQQYLPDTTMRGYEDARLSLGAMTEDEVRIWTEAIQPSRPPNAFEE
jgi:Uncharacterised nucleotidyltransferase